VCVLPFIEGWFVICLRCEYKFLQWIHGEVNCTAADSRLLDRT
jgi:hypothetical protein